MQEKEKPIDYARNPWKATVIKDATDKRLHTKMKKVKEPHSTETYMIIDAMKKIIKEKGAIGLAAAQIGINRNIIVVLNDITNTYDEFINPEIIEAHETDANMKWQQEGCLSHVGLYAEIARPDNIIFKAQRLQDSKVQIFRAAGIISRIIQHEIDHNNGVLFTDKGMYFRNPTLHSEGQMELMKAIGEAKLRGQEDFRIE